jgi:serine/threonine protein kinase
MTNEPLKPGHLLHNRYVITHRKAISGVGALYQARDLQPLGRERRVCAIKEVVLGAPDSPAYQEGVDSFMLNGERLASLSHPAIPRVREYFVDGDCAYLVTEFVQGRDLENILCEERNLPAETVHRWALELCDVLHYLHTRPQPIIFRDVKPSNVMIDWHSKAHLVDFGIAVPLDPHREHAPLGTDGYAAPEQYQGEVSPVIDIYGLGATLHHLLTGRDPRLEPPFTFGRRPIREINPAVPEPFAAVVMQAVEREPWKRFASAAEMKKALEHLPLAPSP